MLLTTPAPTPIEHASAVPCRIVELQTHKAGNRAHECEDSACGDPPSGLVALSDGAGEGIFSREWSRLLVDSFIRHRPNFADAIDTTVWLDCCRRNWFEQVNRANLGWAHRDRVEKHGTGATLLTLRLYQASPATLAFHVQAVGDTCVFWVRDQQCRGFFPLSSSDDFAAAPELFSTHGEQAPSVVQAGGFCLAGDRFILATDAVSQGLFRMLELGRAIDWIRFGTMTSADWQAHIDALRKPHNPDDPHGPIRLENDDCTLLMVSVAPDSDMV